MSEMDTLHEKEGTAGATATVGQVGEERPTFASISKKAANLRDVVELTGQDVKGLHRETVLAALDERAAVFGVQDPSLLLDVLGTEYGLSWSTVAKMIGVTPTAIRKWRRGEQLTPQNRQRLALLLAFLELLRSPFPVADPASWLEMPISAEATLTPADLYAANRRDLLVDLASLRQSSHAVLDAFDPAWRTSYATDDRFAVVRAPDGALSIREKPTER
jgi:transcriptional regulator with XRE-family HTH domain